METFPIPKTGDAEAVLHATGWLVTANLVGVLLALQLCCPQLHGLTGALSYGRMMPVHLNLQLYGWCALPLLGVLMRFLVPGEQHGERRRKVLDLWSLALLAGATSWLAGQSSGKIFLDWSGGARWVFLGALTIGWCLLAHGVWMDRSKPSGSWFGGKLMTPLRTRGLVLLGLLPIPLIMAIATSQSVYPAVDPTTGGPTGTSLLQSSLGLVALIVLLPRLAGLRRRTETAGPGTAVLLAGVVVHGAASFLMGGGDADHHAPVQYLGLASLVLWLPVLGWYLRGFAWSAVQRRWLWAFFGWGAFLTVNGVVAFLPGVLDSVKFTNVLVGHSHAAMGGMLSALNVLLLTGLAGAESPFAQRQSWGSFGLWHGGFAVQVAALTGVGLLEAVNPGVLFGRDQWVTALYGARLVAGAGILWVSVQWLRLALVSSDEAAAAVLTAAEAAA